MKGKWEEHGLPDFGDGGEVEGAMALRRPDRRDGLDEALLLMTLVISFFAYVRALMMLLDLPENPS